MARIRTRRGEHGPHRRIYPTRGGLSTIPTDQRIANSDRRSRSYRPGDQAQFGNVQEYRIKKLLEVNNPQTVKDLLEIYGVLYAPVEGIRRPPTDHYTELWVDEDAFGHIREIWGSRNIHTVGQSRYSTGEYNVLIKLLWKEGEGVSPTLP